jgi:glycosyltransferase involved in cell wall biosynthesis
MKNNKLTNNKKSIINDTLKCILIISFCILIYILLKPFYKFQNVDETYSPDKLYWNNETSLNIDKISEEIKNYKNKNFLKISFNNKTDFIKKNNPKISLIITLYNQEKYLKLVYISILKQDFKDIEIIFVDDASTDNSSNIIKELMENDKRIIYLKNHENKKTFYSRNKGILQSKGEYILIVDPDDLLLNNILIKAYETAKKYNLDIVHFYVMWGKFFYQRVWTIMKYTNGILHNNSEVRNLFYYGKTRNLADKLIKREVYIKSINFMRKDLYNEDYHINDDDTAFFGIVHFAKNYGFLEQIGYFYYQKKNKRKDRKSMNINYRSIFNILKYFYIQSDNNTFEKTMMPYAYFTKKIKKLYEKYLNDVTDGFDFILDVINLFSNSTYFNETQKNIINNYKKKVIDRRNKVKGYT